MIYIISIISRVSRFSVLLFGKVETTLVRRDSGGLIPLFQRGRLKLIPVYTTGYSSSVLHKSRGILCYYPYADMKYVMLIH